MQLLCLALVAIKNRYLILRSHLLAVCTAQQIEHYVEEIFILAVKVKPGWLPLWIETQSKL